jgi:hypothetical protein
MVKSEQWTSYAILKHLRYVVIDLFVVLEGDFVPELGFSVNDNLIGCS